MLSNLILEMLKNEPLFRAQYVSSIARTLAASFDGELFDLLIAAAMGKKGAVIEMDFPKRFDPQKVDIYLKVADIVSEIEKILSEYYMGVPRKQVLVIVDPKLFSRVIRGLLGTQILMEKALDFIQNEQITPTVISGISITRHIALDNEFRKTFGFEDFNTYQDHLIFKAVRYGCERVDLESGGTITGILAEKPFPGHLTKTQEEAVKEAVA
ncbi:2045_t:CDS:2 [Funneliformis caledonium]|uniref:2045_t:CDS:1 n=1 Tax=Funneliformis caledonium TaxID=1117310 RepID=A0A9N9HEF3_9GLOM|nr:2045_t:CDS:2 [Funneliformis caledonium]